MSSGRGCKVIIGYYPGYKPTLTKPILDVDASKLTHFNYAFATIQDGKLAPSSVWLDTLEPIDSCPGCPRGRYGQVLMLKQKYPHLKTLISIGGWGQAKAFSDVARTKRSRDRFTASVVEFLRKYKFDGADVDWEFPVIGDSADKGRPEDKRNFSLLLQNLRQGLDKAGKQDGRKYLLTVAVGIGPQHLKNIEVKEVEKWTDWINLMTYDYHGPWESIANHNAPLYADERYPEDSKINVKRSVEGYINAGVSPSNLVLGIPFYGRGWTQCNPTNHGEYQECPGKRKFSPGYRELVQKYIGKNGYTRYWNKASEVPYLFNPSNKEFISYDDPESIQRKIEFMLQHRMKGAMIWELDFDTDDNSLLTEVHRLISRAAIVCEAAARSRK